ncbi:MAG: DNA alkylation response protein, partial [Burkholderiales bacterium]
MAAPRSPRAPEGVPDSRGLNLFHADPSFRGLLELHLERKLFVHLMPHMDALGGLAGARLDELALEADKNPPALKANSIEKSKAYKELEAHAFGTYGLAAMSHRGGVLGWPEPLPPLAKYALSYLFVQAEFGVCCPLSMTDALTRTIRKFADPALVTRYLPGLTSQDMDTLVQGAMFMTEQ